MGALGTHLSKRCYSNPRKKGDVATAASWPHSLILYMFNELCCTTPEAHCFVSWTCTKKRVTCCCAASYSCPEDVFSRIQ